MGRSQIGGGRSFLSLREKVSREARRMRGSAVGAIADRVAAFEPSAATMSGVNPSQALSRHSPSLRMSYGERGGRSPVADVGENADAERGIDGERLFGIDAKLSAPG